MSKKKPISDPLTVAERLAELDLTVEKVRDIALTAAAAGNSVTRLHPLNGKGMYSWMEGTQKTRSILIVKEGWNLDNTNQIPSIENREKGVRIIFQNVDNACGISLPKPISEKKSKSKELINKNCTPFLFDEMEQEENEKIKMLTWYLCVSFTDDSVRAELSLPAMVSEDGQFAEMIDRIFAVNEDFQSLIDEPASLNSDAADFDVSISRK